MLVTPPSRSKNARLYNRLQEYATNLEDLVAKRTAELEKLYAKVQKLSVTDELTGVFNRRGLKQLAERELSRARRFGHPLSAILFDLDLFKEVNDTYGHRVGDQVLTKVAQTCDSEIRRMDILGRYGGEEFLVILPETTIGPGIETAERLRKSVASQTINTDQGDVSMTISLGVTSLKDGKEEFAGLIDRADQAMYKAKRAGRNCVMNIHQKQE